MNGLDFSLGVCAGAVMAIRMRALSRSTMRGAAFSDAGDFLRAMSLDARFRDWAAVSVLRHAASYLDAWASEPSGGRERMPLYGFKGPLPSPGTAPGKDRP